MANESTTHLTRPRTWMAGAVVALLTSTPVGAQLRYPGESWDHVRAPEQLGYSSVELARAREFSETLQTAAVMVVVDGLVLAEWGDTARKLPVHSVRKSLLSALFGVHVASGAIDVTATLEELGIDDNEPSLTPEERGATVEMLLQSRSGVYHPALYETRPMAEQRPPRGSRPPGAFWYYNNWDFNALSTIFRNLTRRDVFREFARAIADPIGMQDFQPEDGTYLTGPDSVHAAYPFRMTARDMARFGLLFLRRGRWEGRQVVPESWVDASATSYSDAGELGGYGYMWWVTVQGRHFETATLPDGSYSARGAGGHLILVIPERDMVIVHRVATDVRGRNVSQTELGALVSMILAARSDGG